MASLLSEEHPSLHFPGGCRHTDIIYRITLHLEGRPTEGRPCNWLFAQAHASYDVMDMVAEESLPTSLGSPSLLPLSHGRLNESYQSPFWGHSVNV